MQPFEYKSLISMLHSCFISFKMILLKHAGFASIFINVLQKLFSEKIKFEKINSRLFELT